MRRWRTWTTDETGTASLEFVTAGFVLLLPMVYLVLTMAALQAGAFAVEGAARQAARVFVQATAAPEAEARANRAVAFALADYGLDGDAATVSVVCAPRPDDCLHRLGTVTVTVGLSVPLPLVPPVLRLSVPLSVPLEASATERVSRFWGAG
ncbi:MAG TPA: hypothetical protein VGC18_14540 [Lacisediminihabitans sp.]|uniref:hypothetical protein n=1 Tax=Lacisediminihabitans sp. TaxID=2787631 RepID=UPI002ED8AFAD